MMIVQCDACKYTFEVDGPNNKEVLPHRCPDCGAFMVRPATGDEIAEYHQIQKELMEEGWFDDVTSNHDIHVDCTPADYTTVDTVALGRIAV